MCPPPQDFVNQSLPALANGPRHLDDGGRHQWRVTTSCELRVPSSVWTTMAIWWWQPQPQPMTTTNNNDQQWPTMDNGLAGTAREVVHPPPSWQVRCRDRKSPASSRVLSRLESNLGKFVSKEPEDPELNKEVRIFPWGNLRFSGASLDGRIVRSLGTPLPASRRKKYGHWKVEKGWRGRVEDGLPAVQWADSHERSRGGKSLSFKALRTPFLSTSSIN